MQFSGSGHERPLTRDDVIGIARRIAEREVHEFHEHMQRVASVDNRVEYIEDRINWGIFGGIIGGIVFQCVRYALEFIQ
jgi:hypothetical protein